MCAHLIIWRYITSDCDAVAIIHENQTYTASDEDSIAVVLKAGWWPVTFSLSVTSCCLCRLGVWLLKELFCSISNFKSYIRGHLCKVSAPSWNWNIWEPLRSPEYPSSKPIKFLAEVLSMTDPFFSSRNGYQLWFFPNSSYKVGNWEGKGPRRRYQPCPF